MHSCTIYYYTPPCIRLHNIYAKFRTYRVVDACAQQLSTAPCRGSLPAEDHPSASNGVVDLINNICLRCSPWRHLSHENMSRLGVYHHYKEVSGVCYQASWRFITILFNEMGLLILESLIQMSIVP